MPILQQVYTFFNMRAPANFPHTIQSLTEELKMLKAEQDKVMELAVYVGMTKEQAQQCDERRKRIHEIYETLFAMMTPATQSWDTTSDRGSG